MSVKSTITHKLDIPHEEGQWIEFRELGWRTLELSREAKSRTSMMSFRDLGPEFFKALTTPTEGEPHTETSQKPVDMYDMSTLLRASIASWSYPEPCNESNIDSLDPKTATWAFDEIIRIHFPTEEALGKVSEPSSSL